MKRAVEHFRGNVVGYLALFVALGGTSYAISVPAGSVGTRQLRNGAVTPGKLNGHSIAGYVAFWAKIDANGNVIASSRPAVTAGWAPGQVGASGTNGVGTVQFHAQLPANCFAIADVTSGATGAAGSVTAVNGGSSGRGQVLLQVLMQNAHAQGASEPIDIADICP